MNPLYLAAGFLLVLLAVWILWANPESRENQALGLLLLLLAGSTVALGRMHAASTPEARRTFLHVIFWYEVPGILVFALFLDRFFFGGDRSRPRALALGAAGALVAGLLAVLALRPSWYTAADGSTSPLGFPVGNVYGATYYLLWGVTVLLAARAVGRAETALARKQAALVGVAFALLAGHTGGSLLVNLPSEGWTTLPRWGAVAALAAVFLAAPRLVRAFRGRAALATASLLAGGLLLGAYEATGDMLALRESGLLPGNTRVLALVAFAGVLAVAVVRFGLAGVRTDARDVLARRTGLTALLVGVGALVAGGLYRWGVAPEGLAAAAAGVLVPVGLAFTPARRLPRALVDRLLIDPGDPTVLRERVRIYRSTLEEAMDADGELDASARTVLAELRAELGLTERDHAVLCSLVTPEEDEEDTERPWLGRYLVEEPLGRGAHGRVYRATDTVVGRTVVLKRLPVDAEASDRLEAEMRALADLDHENVVTLYTAELVDDELFLVLEDCSAGTLADRLEEGPLAVDEAVDVTQAVLDALGAVHAAGLVHGDVKPANVFGKPDGTVKLGDFGATLAAGVPEAGRPTGTLATMAPERLEGAPPAPACDVYAAGCVLYRALTGQHPLGLDGEASGAAAAAIRRRAPRLDHEVVPDELRPVLERALAKDPAERFASAEDFREALTGAVESAPPTPA